MNKNIIHISFFLKYSIPLFSTVVGKKNWIVYYVFMLLVRVNSIFLMWIRYEIRLTHQDRKIVIYCKKSVTISWLICQIINCFSMNEFIIGNNRDRRYILHASMGNRKERSSVLGHDHSTYHDYYSHYLCIHLGGNHHFGKVHISFHLIHLSTSKNVNTLSLS